MAANIKPDDDPFGPFTVAEVERCFRAFDLDNNNFVGAGELRKLCRLSVALRCIDSLHPNTQSLCLPGRECDG